MFWLFLAIFVRIMYYALCILRFFLQADWPFVIIGPECTRDARRKRPNLPVAARSAKSKAVQVVHKIAVHI